MFRGNAEAKVDEKGRLKLPSRFLSVLPESFGRRFYVTSLIGDCVWIYPMESWRAVERKLADAPSSTPSIPLTFIRKFRRNVNFFGQESEMDAAERILLPALLRERAATTGDVFVVGFDDHLEVWNRQRFESKMQAETFDDTDLENLAHFNL